MPSCCVASQAQIWMTAVKSTQVFFHSFSTGIANLFIAMMALVMKRREGGFLLASFFFFFSPLASSVPPLFPPWLIAGNMFGRPIGLVYFTALFYCGRAAQGEVACLAVPGWCSVNI